MLGSHDFGGKGGALALDVGRDRGLGLISSSEQPAVYLNTIPFWPSCWHIALVP